MVGVYPAHDPRTPTTLPNHIPRTFPNLPSRQPPRISRRVSTQEPGNQLDAVGNSGTAIQQVGQGSDVLVLAAQGLSGELGPEGEEVGVDLATGLGEGVEGV